MGVELPIAALGADKAFGKPQTEQFRPASVLSGKTLPKFLEPDRICLSHVDVLLFSFWVYYRTATVL